MTGPSVLIAASAVFAVGTALATPPPADALTQQHSAGARRQHITRPATPVRHLLSRKVAEVNWDDAAFGDVVSWFRAQSPAGSPVNIVPRWRSLAAEGVTRDTPVTLHLRHVSVGQVLNEVLDSLSGADPLTYAAAGNILRITTLSQLRSKLYTQVYDVREIIVQMRAAGVRPRLAIGNETAVATAFGVPGAGIGVRTETIQTGSSINGGTIESPFEDINRDDDDDDDESDEEIVRRIIDTITAAVAPDSWFINGGRGTIEILDGILIVHNSADVHTQLGGPHRRDR